MNESIEHADLVAFAKSRGGRLLSSEFKGVSAMHVWCCAVGHEFEASPRLLIHGGYWCPVCAPTVHDTSGWDWDGHAQHDPLLADFHLPLKR